MKHNWAIINDYQQHFTKMWASTSKYVGTGVIKHADLLFHA